MIKYALRCFVEHEFEAWFSNSDAYDKQAADGLIECPFCGSKSVSKAIMAPAVKTRKGEMTVPAEMRQMAEMLHQMRQAVESQCDYVGANFASEARDMHEGVTPERPIYGEATPSEVKALKDEGIPVMALPKPEALLPPSEVENTLPPAKLN